MAQPHFIFSGYDSEGIMLEGGESALEGGADKQKFYIVGSARIGPTVNGVNVGNFKAQRYETVSHMAFAPLPLQLAYSVFERVMYKTAMDPFLYQPDDPDNPEPEGELGSNDLLRIMEEGVEAEGADARAVSIANAWREEWTLATLNAYSSTKRKPKGLDPSFQRGKANCRTGGMAEFCWDIKLTKKMHNPNVYNKREKDAFDQCRDILESDPDTAADRDLHVQTLDDLIVQLQSRKVFLEAMDEFADAAQAAAGGDEEQGQPPPPPPPPPPPRRASPRLAARQ